MFLFFELEFQIWSEFGDYRFTIGKILPLWLLTSILGRRWPVRCILCSHAKWPKIPIRCLETMLIRVPENLWYSDLFFPLTSYNFSLGQELPVNWKCIKQKLPFLIGLASWGCAIQRLLTYLRVNSLVLVLFPGAKEGLLPGPWATGPVSGFTGTEKGPKDSMSQKKSTLPF